MYICGNVQLKYFKIDIILIIMAKLHLAQQILDIIYPVGSVYLSWNSTDPKNLFGGTWTRLSGGFLYGCVSSVGTGNGTGTSTNSHTLTINEMPAHSHTLNKTGRPLYWDSGLTAMGGLTGGSTVQYTWDCGTQSAGGGKGHSHNIPYIAVFAWRRTK